MLQHKDIVTWELEEIGANSTRMELLHSGFSTRATEFVLTKVKQGSSSSILGLMTHR
jgi:hypothetical protein